MILFIKNNVNYHYEIIETIITNYHKILNIEHTNDMSIFISIINNSSSNSFFIKYIKTKYPQIQFSVPSNYDYCIEATIYDRHYNDIKKNSNKYFYISHEVTNRLKQLKNVLFLTPLGNDNNIIADRLPYIEDKIKSNIPIYIIQGNITAYRRNYTLLQKILDSNYEYKFIIKLVGGGKELPDELKKYSDKIVLKKNLNFIDFHKEFLDAYCILPLITKNSHKQYYTNKLTSSINYCIGYQLKCLIDKDLQDIYNLNNVEVFKNENDIVDAFKKSLHDFYNLKPVVEKTPPVKETRSKVNLIYFKDKSINGNFGDELSKYITEKMINTNKYELVYNKPNIDINIVCIGSYIHCAKNNSFIFGSGVRTENNIESGHLYKNLNVCAVRGPLTKDFLEKKNIKVGNVFGDPALLLPKFYQPIVNSLLKDKIGIVPHKSNFDKYNSNIDLSIYHLINPTDSWGSVINSICSCKAILSSSLHGLICSDAYNIPNLWLDNYPLAEGDFKFRDYFASQNRPCIKIKKLNELKEELLYKDGNKIDLELLINAFPLG